LHRSSITRRGIAQFAVVSAVRAKVIRPHLRRRRSALAAIYRLIRTATLAKESKGDRLPANSSNINQRVDQKHRAEKPWKRNLNSTIIMLMIEPAATALAKASKSSMLVYRQMPRNPEHQKGGQSHDDQNG